jgi:hypothetical protein
MTPLIATILGGTLAWRDSMGTLMLALYPLDVLPLWAVFCICVCNDFTFGRTREFGQILEFGRFTFAVSVGIECPSIIQLRPRRRSE